MCSYGVHYAAAAAAIICRELFMLLIRVRADHVQNIDFPLST